MFIYYLYTKIVLFNFCDIVFLNANGINSRFAFHYYPILIDSQKKKKNYQKKKKIEKLEKSSCIFVCGCGWGGGGRTWNELEERVITYIFGKNVRGRISTSSYTKCLRGLRRKGFIGETSNYIY